MPSRRSRQPSRNRPPTTPTMSSALATGFSSRPQRSTAGRNAQKVASYAEDDAAGDDESGEEDEEEDAEGEDDAADEDDDYTRLAGAVARHRQVAALAAGVSYTPDHKVRRAASASKPRHSASSSSSNHKRISQARIDAIENVILPDQGDTGWMAEPASPQEAPHIFTYILHAIKAHVARGRRLAESIEHLPNDQNFLGRSDHPISLSEIETNIAQGQYQASRPFELDMLSMFTTFRRGYQMGTQPYADTVTLQRLYQRLTRRQTNQRFTSVQTIMENHRTGNPARNFASVPFGPGEATRGQATDLTTRPVIRGKLYYTHAFHKGYTFRVGDWVQLMNATDPAKPTVAQIFKIAKREDERNDPPVLSCCWYYRPEQTVHPASRRFVAEEVFKTGLFADHPVDDVIEKTQVLFYTKWTRGRPGKADWDPRSPLYFCEARYNERTYDFNKIKNWNSCLPEEQRGMEAPIIYFPEPHPQPNRIESPFLRGVKGPGRLCEEDEVGRGTGESPSRASQDIPDPFAERPRKKQRTEQQYQQGPSQGGPSPPFGGNTMLPPGHAPYPPGGFPPRGALVPGQRLGPMSHLGMAPPGPTQPSHQVLANAQAILQKMASTMPDKIGGGDFNRLQQLFAGPNARGLDLQSLASSVSNRVDFVTLARWRDAMQAFVADMTLRGVAAAQNAGAGVAGGSTPTAAPPAATVAPSYAHPARPAIVERTLAAALAGIEAWCVPLPGATRDLFTGEVVTQGEDAKGEQQEKEKEVASTSADGADPVAAAPAKVEDAEDTAPQVKWFPGPPMYETPRKSDARPPPSLAYLAYRASQEGTAAKATEGGEKVATYFQDLGLGSLWESLVAKGAEPVDGGVSEGEEETSELETAETRALAQALLAAQ